MGTPRDKPPWAVLVYMVADQKTEQRVLDDAADAELRAIVDAARQTGMPVLMQVDYRLRRGVRRISATSGQAPVRWQRADRRQIGRHVVKDHAGFRLTAEREPESDAASSDVLRAFLEWGREQVPAERYAILFWGHSCGPGGLFYDNRGRRAAQPLDLNDLADALSGDVADIVLFRDCWMSTLETAFELRNVARYAVASQAQVPVAGQWPWVDLFAILQTTVDGNEDAVARALAARLGTYHDDPKNRSGLPDVPYALIDLRGVRPVASAMGEFVRVWEQELPDRAIVPLVARALRLARPPRGGDPALVDVWTLCAKIAEAPGPVGRAAAAVATAVADALIKWNRSRSPGFSGVSAYWKPPARVASASYVDPWLPPDVYETLAISRLTRWNRVALHPLQTRKGPMSKDDTFGTPRPASTGAKKTGAKKKAAKKASKKR